MLRRIQKIVMIVAVSCSLSAPVFAADVAATVNGRVRSWLEQVAVKDGTSNMQMKADGRIGASISATKGSWTATAFQNMDLDSDAGVASPTILEQKITLGNESIDVTLGRSAPYGVSKGMAYGVGPIYGGWWVGETLQTTDVADHLIVTLKGVGLTAIVGMNYYDSADSTNDARNETVTGLVFDNTFGVVELGVEFIYSSSKVDAKDTNGVRAANGGSYDGQKFSALALGIGFAITDKMGVAINLESNSKTDGTVGAKADKNTMAELWFDLGIGDASGISVGAGTATNDDGSTNKATSTHTNLTGSIKIGIADLWASYLATTRKDDDIDATTGTATDTATITVAAGLRVVF